MQLLLLSNSTNHASGYLEHAMDAVLSHLADRNLLFIPYALADHDAYTSKVRTALEGHGITVTGIHELANPQVAIQEAEALFVGGGNSFRLLKTLQDLDLIGTIRQRVSAGMPYMGASAGTNIAAPTIRTTNDMPIVEPASLSSLGLVPFQINPHYLDADPRSTHNGETRQTRLREYLEENSVPVLALREGTWISASEDSAVIHGNAVGKNAPGPARLFTSEGEREISGDVSFLLG